MDFLLGALLTAVLFICLFMAYTYGQMNAAKPRDLPLMDDEDFELEEQRQKAKELKKGFDEMMSYNEAKARKG